MELDLRTLNRWRPTEADFLTLEPARCVACGACTRACAAGLWSLPDPAGPVALAPDYRQRCLECGACDQVCDARAITFRYPPGGTGVIYEQG